MDTMTERFAGIGRLYQVNTIDADGNDGPVLHVVAQHLEEAIDAVKGYAGRVVAASAAVPLDEMEVDIIAAPLRARAATPAGDFLP